MGITMQDMYRPSALDKPIRKSGTLSGVFKPPTEEKRDLTESKAHEEGESKELEGAEKMHEKDQEMFLEELIKENPAMVQRVLKKYMQR